MFGTRRVCEVTGVTDRLLGLCLPATLFCVLDGALTLEGQPTEYWSGDFSRVNEASPTFNHLLQIHPVAYTAGLVVWIFVFAGVIILVPNTLALILSIAVTF